MKYKIATGDPEGRATHWFACFMAFSDWEAPYDLQTQMNRHSARVDCTGHFNIGDTIEFESEEDFVVFKLKWSV